MASYVECFPKISRMPGMRRFGKVWKGPCPYCGEGDDRFHVFQGRNDFLGLWCRQCCDPNIPPSHLYKKLESLGYIPVQEYKKPEYRRIDRRVDAFVVTYADAVVSMIMRAIDTSVEHGITFEEAWMQHGVEPMTLKEARTQLLRSLIVIAQGLERRETNKLQSDHRDEAFKRAALREAQLREHQSDY